MMCMRPCVRSGPRGRHVQCRSAEATQTTHQGVPRASVLRRRYALQPSGPGLAWQSVSVGHRCRDRLLSLAALQSTRFVTSPTERPVRASSAQLPPAPDLAPAGDAAPQGEAPGGGPADRDGPRGVGRNPWDESLDREVGTRQRHGPAGDGPPLNTGGRQPAISVAQAHPVLPPPGQDPDHILGQVPGLTHHHPTEPIAPAGVFPDGDGQRDGGPKPLMSRPTLGGLAPHGVAWLLPAIPRLCCRRELPGGDMRGHRRGPPSPLLIAARPAQAPGEADRAADRDADDRMMGQGRGAMAMVILVVDIVHERPHVCAQGTPREPRATRVGDGDGVLAAAACTGAGDD